MAKVLSAKATSLGQIRSSSIKKVENTCPLKPSGTLDNGKSKQADPIATATVTAASANVRKGPGSNYERIGGVTKGKTIQIYEDLGDWLKISYATDYGYISKACTDYTAQEPTTPTQPETPATETKTGTVVNVTSYLNVRDGVGTSGTNVIGKLYGGDSVTIIGEKNGWYQIQYGSGTGWVCGDYIKVGGGSTTDPGQNTQNPETPSSADSSAPAGATYTGNETIKKGSSNKEAVKTLQLYLNKYLASSGVSAMTVDSSFGNTTWKYLMYYQYSRNICDSGGKIDVDGICGPATWKAIRSGAPVVYDIREPIPFASGKKLNENCTTKLSCGGAMCPSAAAQFEKLITAAKAAGHTIKASSTFRGMTDMGTTKGIGSNGSGQIELYIYWNANTSYAAKPGYSNHQSGKAIDISGIKRDNDTSPLYKWLCNNAKTYKFSGYSKECWHWNYIG
ncbi:MAG: SH3 domain-containing protein [Proteobacteria bacterium]|nr:SH3 domain-containing protein [Pseudomonadota bacterium]